MYSPAFAVPFRCRENDIEADGRFPRCHGGVDRKSEITVPCSPSSTRTPGDSTGCRLVRVIPPAAEVLRGHHADFHMACGRIALARGDGEGALLHCDEGDSATTRWGSAVIIRHLLDLTRAEALMQIGRTNEAKRALAALRNHIHALGSQMDGPTRESYFARGFPSARILRAAKEYLCDA